MLMSDVYVEEKTDCSSTEELLAEVDEVAACDWSRHTLAGSDWQCYRGDTDIDLMIGHQVMVSLEQDDKHVHGGRGLVEIGFQVMRVEDNRLYRAHLPGRKVNLRFRGI